MKMSPGAQRTRAFLVGLLASFLAVAAPSLASAEEASDQEAVFRAYDLLVERERTRRLVGGAGGVVFGATAMGVGSFVAEQTDTSKTPWLVGGGVMTGLSLLGMFYPTDVERIGQRVRSFENDHSDAEARDLLEQWRRLATVTHQERMWGNGLGILLGLGSLTTGVVLAAGAGNLSDRQRGTVGGGLIGTGVVFLTGSTYGLVTPSDVESSYAQFAATNPSQPRVTSRRLTFDFAAAPSGFFLGARGVF